MSIPTDVWVLKGDYTGRQAKITKVTVTIDGKPHDPFSPASLSYTPPVVSTPSPDGTEATPGVGFIIGSDLASYRVGTDQKVYRNDVATVSGDVTKLFVYKGGLYQQTPVAFWQWLYALKMWGPQTTDPRVTTPPPVDPPPGLHVVDEQIVDKDGKPFDIFGTAIFGIPDDVTRTSGHADKQYQARDASMKAIKAAGYNTIRLRVLTPEFEKRDAAGKATYLTYVAEYVAAAKAQGLLTIICDWIALDGPYSGAAWAGNYAKAQPLATAIWGKLGADSAVMYEPVNEPNNVTRAQWKTAIEADVRFRRSMGYNGILFLDGTGWSHDYPDAELTALKAIDAQLLGGSHQLVLCRHDYANEFGKVWNADKWLNESGVGAAKHCTIESEIGNYNLQDASTISLQWDKDALTYMKAKAASAKTFGGFITFVWGWVDPNALTTGDFVTPSDWGKVANTVLTPSVVVPPTPSKMVVGVDVARWGADQAGYIKANGITLVRCDTDATLAGWKAAGVEPIYIPGTGGSLGAIAADRANFAANLKQRVAAHSLKYCEPLNEPGIGSTWFWSDPGNYDAIIAIYQACHDALKGTGCTIIGSWCGGNHASVLGRTLKQRGALQYMDMVCNHPYDGSGAQFRDADKSAGHRQLMREALAESGLPVAATEYGWPTITGTGDSPLQTEAQQAANVTSFNDWMRQAGVALTTYYNYAGDEPGYAVNHQRPSISPKPGWGALGAQAKL